jgi:FkbM family methyltransferase
MGNALASLKRRLANALGTVLGSHIVAKSDAPYWPERYFVQRLFGRLQPDCVFDVGANEGQYALSLRAQGFGGTILSFEPNPAAYDRLLAASARDANWHCYPIALGQTAGMAAFNVMTHDVFSSFRTPLSGRDTDFASENQVSRTIDVRVERLETLFPTLAREHGFANPWLKMDTQGFDLEVFRGAGAVAKAFCGLLSEVSVRKIYDNAPDMCESIAAFSAGGFDVSALYSVHANLPLKTIEFNCYLVRRDLASADKSD